MRAWTFMILRNKFLSDKRKSWRAIQLDPEVAERTLVAVDDVSAALELDEVRRALLMMSKEQREALILIGAAGFTYEESTEVCKVAVGTMKSRVSRARDSLALILAEGNLVMDSGRASGAMAAIMSHVGDDQVAA